ncbi:MAG: DUF2236 domain-containing protein [Chitinophagales bacterium]|nr:DUF2236 domain-containing protein [Chitinophagales bacterium]
MFKNKILEKIKQLDPANDHWQIVRLSAMYEFPWDFNRALELALYKTYAVPSISKILFGTKQLNKHSQKRYDDTDLLISEIIENGLQSERGKQALQRMNWIHSHYNITNEDYLFVLSTFIFDSGRWIDKYAYRKLTKNERIAGFKVWKEIGEAMNIKNIPETIDAFEAFNKQYEKEKFVYSENNKKVALATENLMLSWFLPKFMFEIARPFLHAVMDKQLLQAFGLDEPNFLIQFLVRQTLRTRSKIASILPNQKGVHRTQEKHRHYKNTYQLKDLGPNKLKSQCPYHAVIQAIKT